MLHNLTLDDPGIVSIDLIKNRHLVLNTADESNRNLFPVSIHLKFQ